MKYNNSGGTVKLAGCLLIGLALLAGMACEKNKLTDPDAAVVIPPAPEPEYKLIWSDEFDGTALNTGKWNYDIGYNFWGNQEQENYQAANVTVANGNLVLTAKKETIGTTPSNYTSGRINTLNKCEFTYGKLEARMKLPRGKGLWPAFWMLGVNMRAHGNTPGVGWPACGELDIMETINSETWISGASHWAKPDGSHTSTSNKVNTTPEEYHVYTLVWNKESIKWYLDGKLYNGLWIKDGMASTSEYHLPFNIILNLAVGGEWPGQVIDETKLPATMLVDYVRVYQEIVK
jgi:beta-glucanase (GH16 family)